MLEWIKRLFRRDPHKRAIYAINQGTSRGNFFVYMNHDDQEYRFLSLPHNEPINVPVDQFESGLSQGIVELLERLPHNVHEICVAQYNEAKSKQNIDRLKQSAASSSLDS